MQIANDFPISLPPDQAHRLLLDLEATIAAGDAAAEFGGSAAAWPGPGASGDAAAPAGPPASPPPQPTAAAAAPPPAPSLDNDLRAGKLLLAVLRSWVARLTRRGRKGHTR